MQVLPLTELDRSLNFMPEKELAASLPVFFWRGYQLNGFGRGQGEAVELESDFAESFFQANPEMSLSELARVCLKLEELETLPESEIDHLLRRYQIKPSSQNKRLLRLFTKLPADFQSWCSKKKCKPGDLTILLSVSEIKTVDTGLNFIAEQSPSLSSGLQAVELFIELTLMQKQPSLRADSFESWLKALKSARYPMRSRSQSNSEHLIKQMPWPSRTQASWQAKGDSDMLSIKLEAKSVTDLQNKLEALQGLCEQMKAKDPWSCS
ncbi:MAG: hypothetical protein HRT45_18170 [Bdellovibrionales bacterium]|nr:hypothetical protein [Bdellovibrionales bacterium]